MSFPPKTWHRVAKSLVWALLVLFKDGSCCSTDCCCKIKRVVDCSGSSLTTAPQPVSSDKGWCKGTNWLTGGEAIEEMLLDNMNITEIPRETFLYYPFVKNVSLEDNNFVIITASAFCSKEQTSNLRNLSLRRNEIVELDRMAFAGLNNLLFLDLSWNKIEIVPDDIFDIPHRLTELNLEGNRIRSLNMRIFRHLFSFERLSLSSNSIRELDKFPVSLSSLEELKLANNSITELKKDVFTNLKVLDVIDLSRNRIKKLHRSTFFQNKDLYIVDLSHNLLEDLPKETFSSLCKMKILDISYNRLTTPHHEWFANVVYQCSRVECDKRKDRPVTAGNRWKCDCSMAKYIMFLKALCQDLPLKVRGLIRYLDITCQFEGKLSQTICEPGTSICFGDRMELLNFHEANANGTCPENNTVCPFLSSKCAGVEKRIPYPEERTEDLTKKMYFIIVGICAALLVTGLVCWRFLKRTSSKRRLDSESSSDDSSTGEAQRAPLIDEPSHRSPPEGSSQYGGSVVFPSSFSGSWASTVSLPFSEHSASVTEPKSVIRLDTEPKQIFNGEETRPKNLLSRLFRPRTNNIYVTQISINAVQAAATGEPETDSANYATMRALHSQATYLDMNRSHGAPPGVELNMDQTRIAFERSFHPYESIPN